MVADLTSETFVRAVDGFSKFDPRRGSDRAWLFGIAAHVFARHCAQSAGGREAVARLGGHRPLDGDEIEELAERIDAERDGRALMRRCEQLPAVERAAIELVDLEGLTPQELSLPPPPPPPPPPPSPSPSPPPSAEVGRRQRAAAGDRAGQRLRRASGARLAGHRRSCSTTAGCPSSPCSRPSGSSWPGWPGPRTPAAAPCWPRSRWACCSRSAGRRSGRWPT